MICTKTHPLIKGVMQIRSLDNNFVFHNQEIVDKTLGLLFRGHWFKGNFRRIRRGVDKLT